VNLFSSFAKRLPIPGLSALGGVEGVAAGLGAGLAGRLTRSVQERAEKIVDRGRTAMGGLGAEVEKRVQAAARDFSEGASGLFREALAARLASPEGRTIMSEISEQVLERLLATRLAALHEDAKRANVAEILQSSAEIVGHAVGEPFVVEAIDREVAAFVALEGHRSLREVLEENGVLASVRTVAITQLGKTARGLFGTPTGSPGSSTHDRTREGSARSARAAARGARGRRGRVSRVPAEPGGRIRVRRRTARRP
jgi:hypothetical protein